MSMPSIEQIDGRPTIRVVRQLPYPAERVWRAVSEPSELQRWFVALVEWEPALGEEFEIFGMAGRVTELDAPRVLAWDWGGESFRFEIEPTDEGCVLTFLHVFTTVFGPAEQRAAGWEIYFGRLDAHLGGAFVDDETAQRQGVHVTESGNPAVRFHRRLEHSIDRVWPAVTEPDEIGRWFPAGVHGELGVGAELRFAMTPEATLEGRVLALVPPRLFEFSWGEDSNPNRAAADRGRRGDPSQLYPRSQRGRVRARSHGRWLARLPRRSRADPCWHGRSGAARAHPEWDAAYEAYCQRGFPAGAPIPAG